MVTAACAAGESAAKAFDGAIVGNSKWCSTTSPYWLQVDLGSNQTITSFVIKHAALGGETTTWNTSAFNIQSASRPSVLTRPRCSSHTRGRTT